MNTTANYHLPQWEATDHITRADLNSAMSAIDTALSGAAQIVTGTYAGDGREERTISLGFTPKAVIVYSNAGAQNTGGGGIYGGLALPGWTVNGNTDELPPILAIVTGGFRVTYIQQYNFRTNMADTTYYYLAIR